MNLQDVDIASTVRSDSNMITDGDSGKSGKRDDHVVFRNNGTKIVTANPKVVDKRSPNWPRMDAKLTYKETP